MTVKTAAKSTIASICITVIIILLWAGFYLGEKYIDRKYIMSNVDLMIDVYQSIPDPSMKYKEGVKIKKRWVVKYLEAERFYRGLPTKDGIDFWINYARNNGWKIKENNSWRNQREQHIHLQKGNMNWYIFHRTGEERWSMMIDVNDIFQKMGL